MRVNSHNGRDRSNALIASWRGELHDGLRRVRRRRINPAKMPAQVESVVDRPSRSGKTQRKLNHPLTEEGHKPGRLLQLGIEPLPIRAAIEPGHSHDGRPEGGVPLHVPREGIAIAACRNASIWAVRDSETTCIVVCSMVNRRRMRRQSRRSRFGKKVDLTAGNWIPKASRWTAHGGSRWFHAWKPGRRISLTSVFQRHHPGP